MKLRNCFQTIFRQIVYKHFFETIENPDTKSLISFKNLEKQKVDNHRVLLKGQLMLLSQTVLFL